MVDGDRQAPPLQTRGRSPWSRQHVRPVLAGLVLIVVLAGVRAAGPAVTGTGPWHQDALPLAGAFEFVLAVLLVAVWLIVRHRPAPGYPADLLRAGLLRVISLGMLAVAVLAGLSRLYPHPGQATHSSKVPGKLTFPTPRVLKGAGAAHNSANLTYISYALLALLLLVAIVTSVLVIRRRVPGRSADDSFELTDEDASTRTAIESGRRALRSFDDAQAAIIACYVAMEASLASAGTARDSAETPDELLARAVGSGLLHGVAAARLTALFYEARYSSHALPATARDEAGRALDTISAELTRRDESGLVSRPSAQGGTP
jgi:hypothetical protein